MCDGLNLLLSCRRNKQKPKMEDRWQICPIALMRGADGETAKVKDRLGANGRSRLKKSLERPHEMHPRWSGWLQRKEDSQPKQYYFWQWIIRLACRPAMIFTVIHFTQVLFFFPAFLGLPVKTGRTNRWTNRCNKNNSTIVSRTTQAKCLLWKTLKWEGQGCLTTSKVWWAGKHVLAVVTSGMDG